MSYLGNLGRKFIASRERQARGQVYATLLTMDDEWLKRAGYDRSELKRHATRPFHF